MFLPSMNIAGLTITDFSLYPSLELQLDWLRAYLKTYKTHSDTDTMVTEQDVKSLYITVCKFSLVSSVKEVFSQPGFFFALFLHKSLFNMGGFPKANSRLGRENCSFCQQVNRLKLL